MGSTVDSEEPNDQSLTHVTSECILRQPKNIDARVTSSILTKHCPKAKGSSSRRSIGGSNRQG